VLSGGHKMQFHPDPMAGWGQPWPPPPFGRRFV
jgi:hypothetical protein